MQYVRSAVRGSFFYSLTFSRHSLVSHLPTPKLLFGERSRALKIMTQALRAAPFNKLTLRGIVYGPRLTEMIR